MRYPKKVAQAFIDFNSFKILPSPSRINIKIGEPFFKNFRRRRRLYNWSSGLRSKASTHRCDLPLTELPHVWAKHSSTLSPVSGIRGTR